jgi:hypothetical protein
MWRQDPPLRIYTSSEDLPSKEMKTPEAQTLEVNLDRPEQRPRGGRSSLRKYNTPEDGFKNFALETLEAQTPEVIADR